MSGLTGKGIIHASTHRLKGRKMFVRHLSVGGDNWKFPTGGTGYDQPYLEIQAGTVLPTQEREPPPCPRRPLGNGWRPTARWTSPERVHGPLAGEQQAVQQWLDGVLPEAEMDRMPRPPIPPPPPPPRRC